MANKRVIDMQELSELGDGWYTFLDSATGGTKKFDMGNMLNATADAQDAAEAAQSAATSAREAADGVVSPTVTPSQITGGTRVTITDVDGTRTFDVMDGPQGEKGDTGDPAAPGSITTDMLADGAVTPDKLAPGVADGYQPALVAGSSRAMLGDPETASWMERTTAADGAALIEAVYGRTLRWNQMCNNARLPQSAIGVTITSNGDGSATVSGTATEAGALPFAITPIIANHKYLIKGCPSGGSVSTYEVNVSGIGHDYGSGDIISYGSDSANTNLRFYFRIGQTFDNVVVWPQMFDLTAMFGAGNEPATVAEFEALYPLPYYHYDSGSLLPVRMEGVETVGFNQWDEEWQKGGISSSTGVNNSDGLSLRSKNYIPVSPATEYFAHIGATGMTGVFKTRFYDADKNYLGYVDNSGAQIYPNTSFVTPANAFYMRFQSPTGYGETYHNDICINISDHSRNGTYEPYWSSERTIPAATYFPQGLRSAGSVYDELTATQAITRVGAVDLGTLTWEVTATGDTGQYRMVSSGIKALIAKPASSAVLGDMKCSKYETLTSVQVYQLYTGISVASDGDLVAYDPSYATADSAAAFKAAMSGVMLHYALATPTTTTINPPLPMSYRVGAGGTERVMVASGTTSAPPIFVTRYPLDPADLAASIAPVDGPIAKTNHQVGDLLMLGFTLCKATQVIVTGEVIEIGTNVTRTTVAAELAALSQ